MSLHHVQLSSWASSTKSRQVRQPARPEELRQSTFEDEFDYTTLVYDLFTDNAGDMRMLCPPPDDFSRRLDETEFRSTETGEIVEYSQEVVDRVSYLRFERSLSSIYGTHDSGPVILSNQPNLSQIFADRNVVFTMQKNNKLSWLADWAKFYVRYHGADAFLIYENASDDYDLTDVYETINQAGEGLEVVVIDWPFKYGPAPSQKGDFKAFWCQRAALNHARLRFLDRPAAALNIDIDEYVWCGDGGSAFSKFRRCGQDFMKIAGFKGVMSVKRDNSSIRNVSRLGGRDNSKWMCNGAISGRTYWQPHTIKTGEQASGGNQSELPVFDPEEVLYFHLRGLRTVATSPKLRSPIREVDGKFKTAMKRKTSLPGRLKAVLRYLIARLKSKSGAAAEVETTVSPEPVIAEEPRIEPIFAQFVRAVNDLPVPQLSRSGSATPLRQRIWAGELFRQGELGAARDRVQALIVSDGERKSYVRFFILIAEEMRTGSKD